MRAKLIFLVGVAVLVLGVSAPSTYALSITQADAVSNDFPNLNNVSIEYLQKYGVADSGTFAGSYTTVFTTSGPGGFTISYDAAPDPTISCGLCGLLVKGVNGQEAVFSLKGWDGKESITGTGFGNSASQIAGVGIVSKAVPEPASLLLLGVGLLAIGIWGRKVVRG